MRDNHRAMKMITFRTPPGVGSYMEVSHRLNCLVTDANYKASHVSLMYQHAHVGPLAENFTPLQRPRHPSAKLSRTQVSTGVFVSYIIIIVILSTVMFFMVYGSYITVHLTYIMMTGCIIFSIL